MAENKGSILGQQEKPSTKKNSICLGTLIWGKLDPWPWWPGIIISHTHCALAVPKKACNFWVFWFGHHTVSEVPLDNLSCLTEGFAHRSNLGHSHNFDKGVSEALQALAFKNCRKVAKSSASKLRSWFLKAKPNSKDAHLDQFPDWLDKRLMKIKSINSNLKKIAKEKEIRAISMFNNRKKKDKKTAAAEPVVYGARDDDIAVVDRIKSGTLDINNFCIGCHKEVMGACQEHPFFFGVLCQVCQVELLETTYGLGEDDIHVGCAVCGSTGDCLVCDKDSCSRVYCPYCVELLVGEGSRNKIIQKSPWFCFLCTSYSEESHGILRPRHNWPQRLREFLHPNSDSKISRTLGRNPVRLRVVVLHDNLGAVNYALQALRLEVERYWCWDRWDELNELNADIRIVKNVDRWGEEKWSELCPVHLLICALPLNSVQSAVGNKLKGRQVGRRIFAERDAGKAFFDFYDIKNIIERNNRSTPLLWAIENVNCYSITISRFLEMEPIVFDIFNNQGLSSPRYVWTNIPDQNFKPNLVDILQDYNSSAWVRSDEPFLEKFPWIAEDLEAIHQPLPANYFRRKEQVERNISRRETRSSYAKVISGADQPNNIVNYALFCMVKKRSKRNNSVWKLHDVLDDEDCDPARSVSINNQSYAEFMGFPQYFSSFISNLDQSVVIERLSTTLPVSLWMHLFKPLQKMVIRK